MLPSRHNLRRDRIMTTISQRIDSITHITEERYTVAPPAPKSVKIELTAKCNFRCVFCASTDDLRDKAEIKRETFERVLLEMRSAGVEEIGLFYLGESFMCKWLEEAIYFAKHVAKFPYVFLTTNGSRATPERVKTCMENGLDSLKFSLNYADEDQFEDIAQVKKRQFHKMLDNMRAAWSIRNEVERNTGHRCGLYASYIMYDGEQGERMKAMAKSMSPFVDEMYALPLYNQAGFVTEAEAKKGMISTAGNRGRMDNLVDGLPCWALFTEGHITYDGALTGCCFSHTPDFDFGNLNEMSFLDAWNSPTAQALRKAHLNKNVTGTACEKCFET